MIETMKRKCWYAWILLLSFGVEFVATDSSVESSGAVCSVDMVIVVDRSGSICKEEKVDSCSDWEKLKDFMINIVEKIDQDMSSPNHRFAVVVYGTNAHVEFELDAYTEVSEVVQHIRAMKYKPWEKTNTAEGLKLAMDVLKRNDRSWAGNVVTVITDGKSTSIAATLAAAGVLQQSRNRVIAIGITDDVNVEELRQMSSPPHVAGQDYFEVPNVEELKTVITDVVITACGPEPQPSEGVCPIDMVIVYDTSGSICDNDYVTTCDDWTRLKMFIAKLVERLDPGDAKDDNRFGLVSYGHTGNIEFGLAEYSDRASVVKRIHTLTYVPYQNTNAADGLRLAKKVLQRDGRLSKPDVVVVVTDGYSTVGGNALDAAKALRDTGARVIGIGVTKKIHEKELMGMTSLPHKYGEDYFTVPNTETLNEVVSKVAAEACKNTGGAFKRQIPNKVEGLLTRILKELEELQ